MNLTILETFQWNVNRLFKRMESEEASVHHAATGIAGEAGELLDASKKSWVYDAPLDLRNCIEELGDLMFYVVAFMQRTGITWDEVLQFNIEKLNVRYPEGYTDQAAQARADKLEKILTKNLDDGRVEVSADKGRPGGQTKARSLQYENLLSCKIRPAGRTSGLSTGVHASGVHSNISLVDSGSFPARSTGD